MTEQRVQLIIFYNGTMFYLPHGIGKVFRNLKQFRIEQALGLKLLQRSNFKHMEGLFILSFTDQDIQTVGDDTLWDLLKLEEFSFVRSKLKVLHEKTFEKNIKLKYVDLRSNQLQFLPKDLFKANSLLERAIFDSNHLTIIETDFTELKYILRIHLNNNVCINAEFFGTSVVIAGNKKLTDFQNLIRANCSSS